MGRREPGSAGAAGSAAPAVQQEEPPAEKTAEITLAFAGDVNLDDSWCVMQHLRSQGGDLSACIDPALIQRMNAADLCCVNNEFAFSDRGAPMAGKAYPFRSRPENVSIWNTLGVDVATLANNHVFDYGGEAFSDTLDTPAKRRNRLGRGGPESGRGHDPGVLRAGRPDGGHCQRHPGGEKRHDPEAGPDSPRGAPLL